MKKCSHKKFKKKKFDKKFRQIFAFWRNDFLQFA